MECKGGCKLGTSHKVAKFRRRRDFNVGIIIFIIIFVYVIINVYLYFTKDHLSIYEVKEGSTSADNVFTGLIIRNEKIIKANSNGYINYYHKEGDRISKNSTVYSIDENEPSNNLAGNTEINLSADNLDEIKKEISDYQYTYSDDDFSQVYDFKYNLENLVLEISNDAKLSNLKNTGTSNSLHIIKAKSSGIITYYTDGLENLTADTVTADNFNTDTYKKTPMRTSELVDSGSPVYKIISKDSWNILLLLNKKQYKQLSDIDTIRITFTDDGFSTVAPIEVLKKGSNYFAKLDLNKYMIQYINQRFVTIELGINSATGLKIPVSSIVKKDFYKIPLEYFTEGGDSGSTGIIKETYNKNGEVQYTFVPSDIYYSDDSDGYIDARLFDEDTWIHSEETGERYQIKTNETASLKGVFNVNKGYAVFRRIEVLYENEEYCIVDKNTKYGLSVYDHIALDGKTAVEQAIIY